MFSLALAVFKDKISVLGNVLDLEGPSLGLESSVLAKDCTGDQG